MADDQVYIDAETIGMSIGCLNTVLFDNLPIGYILVRVMRESDFSVYDLKIEYMNNASEGLLQVDKDTLLGRYYYEEYSNRERVLLELCEEVAYTGHEKEYASYRPKINKYIHFHIYKVSNEHCGILIKDITNTYTAERMIEKQAVTLQRIYDTMETGIFQILDDALLTIIRANQAAYQIMGFTKESFQRKYGTSLLAVNSEIDLSMIRGKIRGLVLFGPGERYEHRVYNNQGEIIWLHSFIRRTKNNEGQEIVQVEFRNCTNRKKLQINLEHERERYRLAMKNSADVIFEYDMQSDICYMYGSLADPAQSKDVPRVVENYSKRVIAGEIVYDEDVPIELKLLRGEYADGESIRVRRYIQVDGKREIIVVLEEFVIARDDISTPIKIIGKAHRL